MIRASTSFTAGTPPTRLPSIPWRWLVALLGVVLLAWMFWVVHQQLGALRLQDVQQAWHAVPLSSILWAGLATLLSYVALMGYDALALRQLGHRLSATRTCLASFVATAIGNNVGVALVSAGAVRMRLYSNWGLSGSEVGVLIGIVGTTFGVGVALCGGLALLLEPPAMLATLQINTAWGRAAGALLLLIPAGYMGLALRGARSLQWKSWVIHTPGPLLAMGQILLAVVDLGAASLALWVLLPDTAPAWPVFLGVFVLAVVLGVVSHVPAGLGVFEAVMILGLPTIAHEQLLASILAYRVIYYFLPLSLAGALGGALALRGSFAGLKKLEAFAQPLINWIAPPVVSVAVFVAGALLLFSGSLPAQFDRLPLLLKLVPLPVIEVSHLAGSLIGLAMVVLAHALYRRIRAAHQLVSWLLVAGVLVSLLKGIDLEEAIIAALVWLLLWSSRAVFDRPARMGLRFLGPENWFAVAAVVSATIMLGLFSYKHVYYSADLWWQFALRGDAPRYLRASVLVAGLTLSMALWQLMRPQPVGREVPSSNDLAKVSEIIKKWPVADAALALLGDKRILFDDEEDAFLMYQVQGRSWIVMGDPIGSPQAAERLVWRIREMTDRHGARPVFYQVGDNRLGMYADLGLVSIKMGEEALVSLDKFSLDGPHRANLRRTYRRAQRDGMSFEVVSKAQVADLMDEFREVSDSWLHSKGAHEKGFSLGRFDEPYLRHFRFGVVKHDAKIVAFANLWTADGKGELSIDLMRHRHEAPDGTMDFLFTELMLWGAHEGYAFFNLGMAPLAGLDSRPLAPLWHRLGTALFRNGEQFYNFQGLRAYKNKFGPVWRSRYLAAPGGIGLTGALIDVAALVNKRMSTERMDPAQRDPFPIDSAVS